MASLQKFPVTSPLLSLADELDRFFPSTMRRALSRLDAGTELAEMDWMPAVDVKEDDKGYTLTADLPGVDPKAIKVELEDGLLTISGERHEEKKESDDGYRRVERFEGSFMRRFLVPDASDPDKVTAKCANGVLTVRVPKGATRRSRQIPITS